MLQNSPTKHQKTQHVVKIAVFVLTGLIFHLLFYKCGLPESQALRAGFGQAPPSGMAHHLAGGGGSSSSWLWEEQMYAKEKTALIPPPPRGWGWKSRGAAPGAAGGA